MTDPNPIRRIAVVGTGAEAQLIEVVADLVEVVVVEVTLQRGEQPAHSVGAECPGVAVSDLP